MNGGSGAQIGSGRSSASRCAHKRALFYWHTDRLVPHRTCRQSPTMASKTLFSGPESTSESSSPRRGAMPHEHGRASHARAIVISPPLATGQTGDHRQDSHRLVVRRVQVTAAAGPVTIVKARPALFSDGGGRQHRDLILWLYSREGGRIKT